MEYTGKSTRVSKKMETPRLILRYRDVNAKIDTITEHQRLLEKRGHVLWGWWKKEHEPLNEHLFGGKASFIYIIDTSKKKLYEAFSSDSFLTKQQTPTLDCIPSYYRDKHASVAGWFNLNSIQEIDYDSKIEKIIGQKTLALNIPQTPSSKAEKSSCRHGSNKNSILHLSDLHFGKDHAFKQDNSSSFGQLSISQVILDDLKSINLSNDIEAILITGDLTTQGDWSKNTRDIIIKELHKIAKELKVPKKNILLCPGNHDIVRYDPRDQRDVNEINVELQTNNEHESSFRHFVEKVTDRYRDRENDLDRLELIELKDASLVFCLLNSCRVAAEGQWTEYGYVGPSGTAIMKEASERASSICEKQNFKLVALHHHLLPVNNVEALNKKGVSLTIDSIELLDTACDLGFDAAIHGHQHFSRVSRYQRLDFCFKDTSPKPLTVFSGGSCGAKKERIDDSMRNSYSILTVRERELLLTTREINKSGRHHRNLFDKLCIAKSETS